MHRRSTWIAVAAYTMFAAGVAHAAFCGDVCVSRGRAIVAYDDKLWVMDQGTCVITEYFEENRYAVINGKLPKNVYLVTGLCAGETIRSHGLVAIGTKLSVGTKRTVLYLAAHNEGQITLVPGKLEENVIWRERKEPDRVTPSKEDTYYMTMHRFEYVADKQKKNQFITISNQKKEVKDTQGHVAVLYPLVLGEEKNAAGFESIDFSGK